MGYRRMPFVPGEWYHCFSRGIDGRMIFKTTADWERFTELLYLANDTKLIDSDTVRTLSYETIFQTPRLEPLVAVGAYCLMGNHPHLLLQEKVERGISRFMHKVGTGYTKYFNLKRQRIGNLMVKPFRSKHVANDKYLRRVVQYIHLNPAELFEPEWKRGKVNDIEKLEAKLLSYKHSSLPDYQNSRGVATGKSRIERNILDKDAMEFIGGDLPPLRTMLTEATEYYAELEGEFSRRRKSPVASPRG